METFTAATLDELSTVATHMLARLAQRDTSTATVLALTGDLGAGKTALVKLLGSQLGVVEEMVSPTFVVMKQYETASDTFESLIHIDAYRLTDAAEAKPLGFARLFLQPKTLICIEWPSQIQSIIPNYHSSVTITDTDDVRTINLEHHG
jgi:tRNA threonylcarbamoyladenosine biosynthesis protein TsaE